MGRTYAGILGPLAFAIVVARGIWSASGVEATLGFACGALFLFALLGVVAGRLADYLVRESVRTQFQSAMAAWETEQKSKPKLST